MNNYNNQIGAMYNSVPTQKMSQPLSIAEVNSLRSKNIGFNLNVTNEDFLRSK